MIIGRVGDILKNYSNKRIKIEGHTDNVPIGSHRNIRATGNFQQQEQQVFYSILHKRKV